MLADVKGLGEGSDKGEFLHEIRVDTDGNDATEVEGFFNLLFAHLFALYSPGSPELKQYIISLLKVLSSSSSDRLSIKYRMYALVYFHLLKHLDPPFSLSNLFNALPRTSPLRLLVYQSLLATATTHDDIDVLELTKEDVEKWVSEWDVSIDEKAAFLKSIVDAYAKADEL